MHYTILAVVPKSIKGEVATKSYITAIMEPYNEQSKEYSIEVSEEYEGEIETYFSNPNGQWDWWRVGGRWDGVLIGNPQHSDNGFNWTDTHETIGNNRCSIDEWLAKDDFFFGVVTISEWRSRYMAGFNCMDERIHKHLQHCLLKRYAATCDVVLLDVHD